MTQKELLQKVLTKLAGEDEELDTSEITTLDGLFELLGDECWDADSAVAFVLSCAVTDGPVNIDADINQFST